MLSINSKDHKLSHPCAQTTELRAQIITETLQTAREHTAYNSDKAKLNVYMKKKGISALYTCSTVVRMLSRHPVSTFEHL